VKYTNWWKTDPPNFIIFANAKETGLLKNYKDKWKDEFESSVVDAQEREEGLDPGGTYSNQNQQTLGKLEDTWFESQLVS